MQDWLRENREGLRDDEELREDDSAYSAKVVGELCRRPDASRPPGELLQISTGFSLNAERSGAP